MSVDALGATRLTRSGWRQRPANGVTMGGDHISSNCTSVLDKGDRRGDVDRLEVRRTRRPPRAVSTLEGLAKQQLITVQDAATVSWPSGAKKPKTRQLHSLTGAGALGGAFWGMLFGLLFFVPLLGLAVGAAMGALAGSLTDVGIDDDFIKRVGTRSLPGTSALFLMSSDAVMDKVRDAFAASRPS